MRTFAVAAAFVMIAACEQQYAPPPLPQAEQTAETPWFICDGIDAPTVLVFHRDGETVRMAEYDKPNGALTGRRVFTLGQAEGAAGSVYTQLTSDGADQGFIRQINTGVLETPAAAYTPVFSSVELDQREIACRWLPRTRVIGFTGRRSFVIHEDRSGDLIYTTYDFPDAASAQPIELSENGRTTTFSVEVRDGAENVGPNGAEYRFDAAGGFSYVVALSGDGTGALSVLRNGEPVQSEPLIAFQSGEGAE